MNVINETDLKTWLSNHEDWQMIDGELVIEMEFGDFTTAFGFLTSVAILAEKHEHHPTIENAYNQVRISMNTHDADNQITDKDLKLAEAIDKL
jgi:4a-hydroxytetrahydrobiopterin dehydratase